MAGLNGFDATQVEPDVPYEPLPAGTYVCIVTASEMKPTKNGHGELLELTLEVVDGPMRGRKVWDRLVLRHPTPQTVAIARARLSALCRAVGVMKPRDSVELHNLPLSVRVAVKRREDNGELTNDVKGYAKRAPGAAPSSPPPSSSPQPSPPQPAAAGGSSSTPPWKR